jgi:CheY-like chemotaxis protein
MSGTGRLLPDLSAFSDTLLSFSAVTRCQHRSYHHRIQGAAPAGAKDCDLAAHMTLLLDDLLDVARITGDRLELQRRPSELQAILATALESARPLMEAKRQRLTVSVPESAVWVAADAVRLTLVFYNLLTNAAKFTPAGGNIELEAASEADAVRVTVRDDGVGISSEVRSRLFTIFAQDERVAPAGGLRVGLYLVHELVALHGGTVEARSGGIGRGSEFSVRLPIVQPTQASASTLGLRVLVVDDNRDASDSCKAVLALGGCEVQAAYTGRRALAAGETLRPHVVLLDIGLPDLSGYEVAQRMRRTEWGQHAVLVALTGWGQAQDRRRAFEAGFEWHVTKPVAPEELRAFLYSVGGAALDAVGEAAASERERPHAR